MDREGALAWVLDAMIDAVAIEVKKVEELERTVERGMVTRVVFTDDTWFDIVIKADGPHRDDDADQE